MLKYLIATLWTIFIVVASGLSKGTVDKMIDFDLLSFDKFAHAFVYCVYVVLWSLALENKYGKNGKLIALYTSIILGVLMEILQATIFNGRSFEYFDIIANISGSVIGLTVFNKFFKT